MARERIVNARVGQRARQERAGPVEFSERFAGRQAEVRTEGQRAAPQSKRSVQKGRVGVTATAPIVRADGSREAITSVPIAKQAISAVQPVERPAARQATPARQPVAKQPAPRVALATQRMTIPEPQPAAVQAEAARQPASVAQPEARAERQRREFIDIGGLVKRQETFPRRAPDEASRDMFPPERAPGRRRGAF